MENSTCHGGSWVAQMSFQPLRVILQLGIILAQAMLFYSVIMILLNGEPFLEKKTSVTRIKNKTMNYPSITICNPRPFDKQVALDMNLTRTELTLLTLPTFFLDPEHIFESYLGQQALFDNTLSNLTKSHNLTLLLDNIMIKCEDFLVKCSYKSLFTKEVDCCEDMFDPKPFISKEGACFTTGKDLKKTDQGSIEVRVDASEAYTESHDEGIAGTTRSLSGPTISFHENDHPLVASLKGSHKLTPGTINSFKLRRRKDDMTDYKKTAEKHLNVNPYESPEFWCVLEDGILEEWSKHRGFPAWSLNNCEFFLNANMIHDCSVLKSIGFVPNDISEDKKLTQFSKLTEVCHDAFHLHEFPCLI